MKEQTILESYGLRKMPGEVGVEVEMEGRKLPAAPAGWNEHEELSLRNGGREYVFSVPYSRTEYKPLLYLLEETFEKEQSKLAPSDYCGIHVHINCQDLTFNQVVNYTCLWFLMEIPLVKWCGDKREGNMFALRASDAEAVIRLVVDALPWKDFRQVMGVNVYRYAAWNLEALSKFGSIESRVLPTTPKFAERTSKWIDVLLKLKDNALQVNHSSEIVSNFSLQSPLRFFKNVLQEHADEFLYDGIELDLYKGVRLIQDIAFAQDFKHVAPKIDKVKQPLPFGLDPAWIAQEPIRPFIPDREERERANALFERIVRDERGRFAPRPAGQEAARAEGRR